MRLKFMGEEFDDVAALRKVYPAFCGDDAVRAIRAGCTTPMAVETYCHRHSRQYLKWEAARKRASTAQPSVMRKRGKSRRNVA